jgi:hypothetical protein
MPARSRFSNSRLSAWRHLERAALVPAFERVQGELAEGDGLAGALVLS